MSSEDPIGEFVARRGPPSPWAVALFAASCAFAAGALLLLVMSWT
jgi:hypothetical protein